MRTNSSERLSTYGAPVPLPLAARAPNGSAPHELTRAFGFSRGATEERTSAHGAPVPLPLAARTPNGSAPDKLTRTLGLLRGAAARGSGRWESCEGSRGASMIGGRAELVLELSDRYARTIGALGAHGEVRSLKRR